MDHGTSTKSEGELPTSDRETVLSQEGVVAEKKMGEKGKAFIFILAQFVCQDGKFEFISSSLCYTSWHTGKEAAATCSTHFKNTPLEELQHSGWYWPNMDVQAAGTILKDKPVGTFLIRDSSHPRNLYTLSIKTERGPRSIRIVHDLNDDTYGLDQNDDRSVFPKYSSVVALAQGYSQHSISKKLLIDIGSGMKQPGTDLKKPLRKEISSLKHLCRLTVNQVNLDFKPVLPAALSNYVESYPYSL